MFSLAPREIWSALWKMSTYVHVHSSLFITPTVLHIGLHTVLIVQTDKKYKSVLAQDIRKNHYI